MRTIIALMITAILVLALSGVALAKRGQNVVDMDAYTCGDLMKERVEDIGLILMWVDGYLSCKTGDLVLDDEWVQEMAETIGDACQGNPNAYLIDIVEGMAEEE